MKYWGVAATSISINFLSQQKTRNGLDQFHPRHESHDPVAKPTVNLSALMTCQTDYVLHVSQIDLTDIHYLFIIFFSLIIRKRKNP